MSLDGEIDHGKCPLQVLLFGPLGSHLNRRSPNSVHQDHPSRLARVACPMLEPLAKCNQSGEAAGLPMHPLSTLARLEALD